MLKLDRLLAIVLMLHSKRLVRAADLSEHFGVSLRTIYRDVNTLCEAGVPIASEAGVGYSLVKGYALPPVMFSTDEAMALVIANEFLQSMSANKDLRVNGKSGVAKIMAILSDELKERMHQLQNTTAIVRVPTVEAQEIAVPTVFSEVQQAIGDRRCMEIRYENAGRERSTRIIEPLGMVYYGNYWHCIAHCRLRDGIRDFRTDRFASIQLLDERFKARPEFSVVDFLKEQYRNESPVSVRILADHRAARYLPNKHYYGFVREDVRDDGVELTFLTPSLHYIARWLFSYADRIRVIEPLEINELFRNFATTILERFKEKYERAE